MRIDAPTLLITDDDRDFRETLRGVFEPRGFRTILAADGAEAVELLRHRDVHLLLLDMHMPRLTGLQTIELVSQFHAPLPCILMSAALDDDIRQAAQRFNVYSVLSKPVSVAQLTGTVGEAMRAAYDWPDVARGN